MSEVEIDSFNIPYYLPTLEQLKAILGRNPNFKVEKMEIVKNTGKCKFSDMRGRVASFRAVHESMLSHHFGGGEIMDELFDRYEKKLADSPVLRDVDNDKTIMILAVLKREGIDH